MPVVWPIWSAVRNGRVADETVCRMTTRARFVNCIHSLVLATRTGDNKRNLQFHLPAPIYRSYVLFYEKRP